MTDHWSERILGRQKIRFLLAGGFNTGVAYGVACALYYPLVHHVPLLAIVAITNVVNVTISYATNKLFVFRTRGFSLAEYVRFYAVSAVPIVLSFILVPLLIDRFAIAPPLAFAMMLLVNVALNYVGHSRISFRPRRVDGSPGPL